MTTSPPTRPPRASAGRATRVDRGADRRLRPVLIVVGMLVVATLVTVGVVKVAAPIGSAAPSAASTAPPIGTFSHHPVRIKLAGRPQSYLGVFTKGVPDSYEPISSFTAATRVKPTVALYYSGWYEKFRSQFAVQANDNGAVPLIQIDPSGVNLAAIASGAFDMFLKTFATDVASYGARTGQGVIIGFGHEMNGFWYSWGDRHTSPKVFVAAWQHIVTVFRQQGAEDVTWLWTVNIIDRRGRIPSPAAWWPGSSYVTWVGIDGYYLKPSWTFASLFGPTIKAVRALTLDPILISETGVAPKADKPAKIGDLFAGVRRYGLLGLVWFDTVGVEDWRLNSRPAIAAFARGALAYKRPAS
jgi:mannan endo-1,4-beta-mannosidase